MNQVNLQASPQLLINMRLGLVGLIVFAGLWFTTSYIFKISVEESTVSTSYEEAAENNLSRQIALPLCAILCAGVLVFGKRLYTLRFGRLGTVFCCYIGWALLSISWSNDPSLTAKRLGVLLMTVLICGTFAVMCSISQIAFIAFFLSVLTLAVSFSAEMTYGSFHPFGADYRFSGIVRPNTQGMCLAMLIISALYLATIDRTRRFVYFGAAAIAFPFLALTKSRTATATCVVLSLIYILWRRRSGALVLIGVLTAASVLLGVATFSAGATDKIMSAIMLGRQSASDSVQTMSNRGPLWEECLSYLGQRPLLGFGYGAFWTPSRVFAISSYQGWPIPHAHDMYLDAALDGGVPAAALFTAFVLGSLLYWVRLYRLTRSDQYLYAALLTLWLCLTMIDESLRIQPSQDFLVYALALQACFVRLPAPVYRSYLPRAALAARAEYWAAVQVTGRDQEIRTS